MYAKTVYFRNTIKSFKYTYFTLSNAGIAEVDTGPSKIGILISGTLI